jgi:gliding motility-associated lipoprotein GldH
MLVMLSACTHHWAETESDFEGGCWQASDTLHLAFDSDDTSAVYALTFPIKVNDDYPFNNIYLHTILRAPSGEETVLPSEFVLMDRTGAWFSEPEGDLVPFQLIVSDGLRFNQKGKYSLKLCHYMRDGELCGVQSAGIRLDPVKP